MIVFNYLFANILRLKIYNSSNWARISVVVYQSFIILPIYVSVAKYIYGCEAFIHYGDSLNLVFVLIGLALLGLNYYYYSVNRIKKLRIQFNEKKIWSRIKLLLLIAVLGVWVLIGNKIMQLFFEFPSC